MTHPNMSARMVELEEAAVLHAGTLGDIIRNIREVRERAEGYETVISEQAAEIDRLRAGVREA